MVGAHGKAVPHCHQNPHPWLDRSSAGSDNNGFTKAFLALGAAVYTGYVSYVTPADAFKAGINTFGWLSNDGTVGNITRYVYSSTNVTSLITGFKPTAANSQLSRVPPPQVPLPELTDECSVLTANVNSTTGVRRVNSGFSARH